MHLIKHPVLSKSCFFPQFLAQFYRDFSPKTLTSLLRWWCPARPLRAQIWLPAEIRAGPGLIASDTWPRDTRDLLLFGYSWNLFNFCNTLIFTLWYLMTNKTLSHLLIVIKLNASRALERNFSLRISLSWTAIKPVSNFLSFYVKGTFKPR